MVFLVVFLAFSKKKGKEGQGKGGNAVLWTNDLVAHIARYCDTIAAIPHIARYSFREVSSSPKSFQTPPCHWCSVLHRHICAIPHFATYRAIIVRYPDTPPLPKRKQAPKMLAILSQRYPMLLQGGRAVGPLGVCSSQGTGASEIARLEGARKPANPSPTLSANLFCQPLSKPLFP